MKTSQEYIASLSAMKHNVWMNGHKVDRPWEHPQIVPGINIVSMTYDWAQRDDNHDLFTVQSHLCFRLIEDLTASKFAGLMMVAGVHGGGSPEAERLAVYRSYDLESRKAIAKKAAGIQS